MSEVEKRGLGCGVTTSSKIRGVLANPQLQKYARPVILKESFLKLTVVQGRIVQSNLKSLGLYKSSIDGLYGKGTLTALTKYNKKNFNNARFDYRTNVAVLALISCAVRWRFLSVECAARWANIDPHNVDYPKAVPMKNAWLQT